VNITFILIFLKHFLLSNSIYRLNVCWRLKLAKCVYWLFSRIREFLGFKSSFKRISSNISKHNTLWIKISVPWWSIFRNEHFQQYFEFKFEERWLNFWLQKEKVINSCSPFLYVIDHIACECLCRSTTTPYIYSVDISLDDLQRYDFCLR
jgi:hypothetical protein